MTRNTMLTKGEAIALLAGITWFVSLPLLAAGYSGVWFAAQGLYFVGIILVAWRYFTHHV